MKIKLSLVHAVLTILWIVLIVPTLLWWRESVLWIALMSIWANIASHASAYSAARSDEAMKE